MAGTPVTIQVDAWSDLACPWCCVGKARLDKAIEVVSSDATRPPAQVVVQWHPYMIDINTKKGGEEYLSYNQRRWGSDGWTIYFVEEPRMDLGLRTGNGGPIHCMPTDTVGKGGEAKQRLFEMTYEEGLNISDLEVLCLAADQLGIPGGKEYIMSDRGKEEVIKQDRFAKSEKSISSVPYFVVENQYSFSGAQDSSTIIKVLQKAISAKLQNLSSC